MNVTGMMGQQDLDDQLHLCFKCVSPVWPIIPVTEKSGINKLYSSHIHNLGYVWHMGLKLKVQTLHTATWKVVFISSENLTLLCVTILKILIICYIILFMQHPVFCFQCISHADSKYVHDFWNCQKIMKNSIWHLQFPALIVNLLISVLFLLTSLDISTQHLKPLWVVHFLNVLKYAFQMLQTLTANVGMLQFCRSSPNTASQSSIVSFSTLILVLPSRQTVCTGWHKSNTFD